MMSALLSRCLILVLGTLYPAYKSYKAIKNKDVREHVKWMMYWIVFALFTTLETFLDIFFSWFPFYYEIKIIFILWVLSPATRGSSLLYKNVVHPMLISREKEIDDLIEKTKQQGYSTFLQLFSTGFNYASNLFVSSAMRGQDLLGTQLRKSLSMNDVSNNTFNTNNNTNTNTNNNTAAKKKTFHTIIEDEDHGHTDYVDNYLDGGLGNHTETDNYETRQILPPANRYYEPAQTKPKNSIRSSSANRTKSNSVSHNLLSSTTTNGTNGTNGTHMYSRDFELIDDEDIDGNSITRNRLASSSNGSTAKRKTNGTKQTTTTNGSSYKTNEASHYGTLTRGKVSKAKPQTNAVFDETDDI